MASDTAPAAVPGPHTPPHSTAPTAPQDGAQQQPGGLAGLLAPVGPARTTAFTLDPSHTNAVTGTSSSAYQNTETADNGGAGKNAGQGKQERSVVRAWLLAGAERWRKGADARNKRLDIKKAKAQARQVKETVTVNRSEKTSGGPSNSSTGSNSGAGKSLGSKSGKGSAGNGPKNTSSGTRNNNSGRSGGSAGGGHKPSTGHGTSGKRGSGAPGGPAGRGTGKHTSSKSGSDAKPSKDRRGDGTGSSGENHPSNSNGAGAGAGGGKPGTGKGTDSSSGPKTGNSGRTGSGGTSGGKTGPQGNPGKPGKDAPGPSGKGTDTRNGKADLDKPKKTKADGERQTGPDTETPRTAPGSDRAAPHGAKTKPGKDSKPGKADKDSKGGKDREAPKNPNSKDSNGRDTRTPAPGQTPVPAPRTRLDTQASREAGYRDGIRIGKVVAHTQAYRDGYRDGRTDAAQTAAAEKARLDKARENRTNTRPHPDKDRPVTQPASSADYQPTVPPKPDHAPSNFQPIEVTGTDATHIHLGQGAARPSISRGEVRTLRAFQQRLDTKTDIMTRVAEATRVLEQHAAEQAKQVTQLLEQAQSVQGGDKLVSTLTRLQDDAQVQATKAAEIHKRATYAADYAKALQTNTQTRYGDIYNAVQDAGDLAQMTYYQEMSNA